MEFSEAEPTPFHADGYSLMFAAEWFSYSPCESWIAGSTPLFFSLSDESFNPCHDLSCRDTDGIQTEGGGVVIRDQVKNAYYFY